MFRFSILERRLSNVLLLTILLMATSVQYVIVKSSPATTVEAGSISLYPNDIGYVPLRVNNIPLGVYEKPENRGLGAYDIKISYNPNVVQVQDIVGGTAPFNTIMAKNIDNISGKIAFVSWQTDFPGPVGSIVIANLLVKTIGAAGSSSNLIIIITSLVYVNGTEIEPRESVFGSVTILTPKPLSSITMSVDRNVTSFGENITVSGLISSAVSASVDLVFTRPDSSKVSRITNSGINGAYRFVFTPDMAGTWTVIASWPGDANYQGAASSSLSFTVEPFGSTISIALSPNSIKPNGTIQISGRLYPSFLGAEVNLAYRLQGETWKNLTKTRTNSMGEYLYNWLTGPAASGIYELKASWPGNEKYEPAESSSLFAVAENSTLSISLSTGSTGINGMVVIIGKVSPTRIFVEIILNAKAPNGTLFNWTVQTDAAGNYRTSFSPDKTGNWSFWSKWLGDFDTLGSESVPVTLKVTSTGSSINLQTSVPMLTIGNTITLFGQITPAVGSSLVTLTFVRQDNSITQLQTMSNANGSFSQTFTPDQAGIWLVQASWPGDINYGGATSPQTSFTVEKLASAITLFPTPPIPKKGDLVRLEGVINPAINEAPVILLTSIDEGKTWTEIASPKTEINGEYSFSWRAEGLGIVCFKTEWSGDENRSTCVSDILYLSVQEEVLHQTVLLPDAQIAEVVLSTNSSAGSITIDAANGRIEVYLTGPNATNGLMNIFIPSSLLENYNKNINDLVFTIDESPVNFSAFKVSNGYLVTILYSHSTRTIAIHYITYSLQLFVKNFKNEPLPQATVLLSGPVRTNGITNTSGLTYFPHIPRGQYIVEVFFGPKVAEITIDVAENEILIIDTIAGKIEVELSQLQNNYDQLRNENQSLAGKVGILELLLYVSVAAIAVFTAMLFLINRKQRKL